MIIFIKIIIPRYISECILSNWIDIFIKSQICYATTIAIGEAESDEVYRRFLEDHLRSGHGSMLSQESIPETGWEGSPIVMKHIERNYDPDTLEYSIAVAALGGTREENTTIVDAILHDIPKIG